jgi:hypothetical protein
MEILVEYVIVFALGWYIGGKLTAALHIKMFKMILEDLKISNTDLINVARRSGADWMSPEQEAKLDELETAGLEKIEIKVEKHGEMLYAFRNDNDQFIGQGTSREDLIKAMAERLRNVHCTVVEGSEYMKSEA